jgi:hypothetical protein
MNPTPTLFYFSQQYLLFSTILLFSTVFLASHWVLTGFSVKPLMIVELTLTIDTLPERNL